MDGLYGPLVEIQLKDLLKTNLIMSAIPNIRPLLEVSDPEANQIRLNFFKCFVYMIRISEEETYLNTVKP